MKKNILLLIVVALCGTIIWLHYPNGKDSDIIKFGTCADYPPMEYYKEDVLTGFEVELAKLIAEKLGKKAAFEDMAFASLPTALKKKFIDAIIAAFGVTKESRQKFDFSIPYYPEVMVFMHKKSDSITTKEHLSKKKIMYQLSGRIKKCLEENIPNAKLISMDKLDLAVESLKAGHVQCVYIDTFVADVYCKKNPDLTYFFLDSLKISDGIGIAVNKESPLRSEINRALKDLDTSGELQKLREKWELKNTWELGNE